MMRASMLPYAQQRMARGDYAGAISPLRSELGLDPDHARAHALLSICLLRVRRRYAAEHEARAALALEPELADAHAALGWVLLARGDDRGAEAEARLALAVAPDAPSLLRLAAAALEARGDRGAARMELERALAIDAADVQTRLALGNLLRGQGALDEAIEQIDAALAEQPESAPALAARGELLLQRGESEDALEHALAALRVNATESRALRLLADVKARQSLLLGLWWRWNAWVTSLQGTSRVAALVGAYAAFRASTLACSQLGAPGIGAAIDLVWMGFALYTWAAIPIYRRMLARELTGVRLRPGF